MQQCLAASTVLSARSVHHNNTWVFERLWEVNTPRKNCQPRLKKRNRVLIPLHPQIVDNNIKCILTEEMANVGYKGDIVDVPKAVFRNKLLPKGKALYASPENIAANEEYLKTPEAQKYKGIDIRAKTLMMKLAGIHLRIPMSGETTWVLNKGHIRVAFRLMGLVIDKDSFTIPEEPITQPGEFSINLFLNKQLKTEIRATVFLAKDNVPVDRTLKIPRPWNNLPVNPDNPIQIISS